MEPVIQVENVAFSYGRNALFSDLSLRVEPNELCGVLGQIASGKSTLIRLIGGLLAPWTGIVRVHGHTWPEWREKGESEVYRFLTMTFQKGGLFDSLNVEENLSLPLRELTRLSETERKVRIDEALEQVGLEGTHTKPIHELSGGMQKRLAIARALILEPKVILLDEPTAGLDPVTSREIIDVIRSVHKAREMTTVFVTCDPGQIFQIADRLLYLSEGKIALDGPPEVLRSNRNREWHAFLTGKKETA